MRDLHVVEHPVLGQAMTVLRAVQTPRAAFRTALADAAAVLAYEALRDVAVRDAPVTTPLEATTGCRLAKPVTVVAVLRAGLGMVDGFLRLVPDAAVGHLGMRRNERTLQPESYYESIPAALPDATVFVTDPMLATGGSAVAALSRLREAGATDLRLVCVLAAPDGVARVNQHAPGVPIIAGALDRGLDAHGYIRPGLGDAGDRLFGTE